MLLKPFAPFAVLAAALVLSAPAYAAPVHAHSSNARHVPGRRGKKVALGKTPTASRSGVEVVQKPPRGSERGGDHHAEPAQSPAVAAVVTAASPPVALAKASEAKPAPRDRPLVVSSKPEKIVDPREPVDAKVQPREESQEREPKVSGDAKEHKTSPKDEAPAAKPEAMVTVDAKDDAIKPKKRDDDKQRAKVATKPCLRDAVEISRGQEGETFSLTKCDGGPAPLAIERLSVLVRPESAPRPAKGFADLAKSKAVELAPGVRRIDAGLIERLAAVVDHFAKAGSTPKISVISGYRPTSAGSYHSTAQALDIRLEGTRNEALVEFCKTLPDTGCGYYPHSSFVHMDVRQPGTGHVSWIDASGPGEPPHYVASWPPPPEPDVKVATEANVMQELDRELPPLPVDEHPSEVMHGPAAVMTSPLDVKP